MAQDNEDPQEPRRYSEVEGFAQELPSNAATIPELERAKPHYCRGCGKQLSPGFRGQFHRDCLRRDKALRLQLQRESERLKFEGWLSKQCCWRCGARYGRQ